MADRGMKKRLPFSSLVEQGKYLEKMIYEKYKRERPQVFNERAAKIDRILRTYDYTSPLKMTIYLDGYVYKIEEKILKIDKNKSRLYLEEFFIPIKNVLDIEETDILNSIC